MPRFYQISLRTILEVTFVIGVVLAFVYWRNLPVPDSSGRYQMTVGDQGRAVFLDTKTGKAWRGTTAPGTRWYPIDTPVDHVPPSTPAALPTMAKTTPVAPPQKSIPPRPDDN
jgi:hypothetical protein